MSNSINLTHLVTELVQLRFRTSAILNAMDVSSTGSYDEQINEILKGNFRDSITNIINKLENNNK